MNEEEKEVTVEFLMNHLAVEDGNTQHKFLSQINSNSSVNFAAYDRRQNRGKSNRPKCTSGKNEVQNKSRVQTSSSTTQPSRKPPGMAQWKIHYMPKEVYILSRPSEFQPVADYITQYTHREPATAVSQSLITSNKLWVDQCRMVTIPRVYRRTRSMLKIRCTDIRQTRHNYSQLTETEKAKFQTPSTYNDERNFVKCNSVKKYQMILSTRQNQILPLLLLLYFQRKGRKLQQTFLHLHLHLYPHWRQSRNSLTLQDQESQ